MRAITPPDSHYLSAAHGWMGLGNWKEAYAELELISPSLQSHPDVLQVRFELLGRLGRWDEAVEVAKVIRGLVPSDPGAWIGLAYALRRKQGGGIPAAKEVLMEAWQLFPKAPIVAYNLACYECQLGKLPEAREWLAMAYKVGKAPVLKEMALEDPDLKPLWGEIKSAEDAAKSR